MATAFCSPTMGVMFATAAAGTALTNTTTPTSLNASNALIPSCDATSLNGLPAAFLMMGGGIMTTKSSTATGILFTVEYDTTQGTAGTALAASASSTAMTASQSNVGWSFWALVTFFSTTSVCVNGCVSMPGVTVCLTPSGSSGVPVTVTAGNFYLDLFATYAGTSSSDSITLQNFQIYALNA